MGNESLGDGHGRGLTFQSRTPNGQKEKAALPGTHSSPSRKHSR